MKKLILPLLLLVGITMLVAVESNPSAVVGYVKYPCYTGYSYVAASMGGATSAQAIGIADQSNLQIIYRFNAASQGWESIEYDGEWLGDFTVNPGDVLLFNCIGNTNYYSMGALPTPVSYNIVPGFNYITVPLNFTSTSAQALADAIGNIPIVYRFNNSTHGWESIEYDGEWLGDMTIGIGDVLLVKSTATTTWPARGSDFNQVSKPTNK